RRKHQSIERPAGGVELSDWVLRRADCRTHERLGNRPTSGRPYLVYHQWHCYPTMEPERGIWPHPTDRLAFRNEVWRPGAERERERVCRGDTEYSPFCG